MGLKKIPKKMVTGASIPAPTAPVAVAEVPVPPEQPPTPVETVSVPVAPSPGVRLPENHGYLGRKNSLAWRPVTDASGEPKLDAFGRPLYQLQRVETKPKLLYCPDCHDYLKFRSSRDGEKACPQCGITTSDHFVKTANGLWPTMKK